MNVADRPPPALRTVALILHTPSRTVLRRPANRRPSGHPSSTHASLLIMPLPILMGFQELDQEKNVYPRHLPCTYLTDSRSLEISQFIKALNSAFVSFRMSPIVIAVLASLLLAVAGKIEHVILIRQVDWLSIIIGVSSRTCIQHPSEQLRTSSAFVMMLRPSLVMLASFPL